MSFATTLNMSKLWLFWGKVVKFCAQIVRNWELFLVYIFVDALAQMFATWYLATSQNILVMPQSWIYPSLFLFLDKIVKFWANVTRNWKTFYYPFFVELSKHFAQWKFITFLTIWFMKPIWIDTGNDLLYVGKNVWITSCKKGP